MGERVPVKSKLVSAGKRVRIQLFRTRLGYWMVHTLCGFMGCGVFSERTQLLINFDVLRMKARLSPPRRHLVPSQAKLHLGCGKRLVSGWLNADIANADSVVDLASGHLPWADSVFDAIVSQHVIEHLDLFEEVIPLLRELRRVAKPGAELWLSCPDMEKICRAYLVDKGATLRAEFEQEFPKLAKWKETPSHMINSVFHQSGQHKNLFDFDLLAWACTQTGFGGCSRVTEADLLRRFPEFPARNDGTHTLYIRASIPKDGV